MSEKRNRSKNNGFNQILYIAGTVALFFMLAFSGVNFIRDARVLKLPVLSSVAPANKDPKSTEDGEYKTLKYKKPTEAATPKPKKTPAPKSTVKPTPVPTRTPEP